MKRVIVIALSVVLALSVAAPIALAQKASESKATTNLGTLTAAWWNWAVATSPSPMEGSYTDGTQCDGDGSSNTTGVWFLAGANSTDTVKRTCTVPKDTPILFPIVNVVCSDAYNPPDPHPLTKCAKDSIDAALVDSKTFATLDGKKLKSQRVASGSFTWTLPDPNVFGLTAGSYDAASDGLWVYLPQGLSSGEHDLQFGGDFPNVGFKQDISYKLIVE